MFLCKYKVNTCLNYSIKYMCRMNKSNYTCMYKKLIIYTLLLYIYFCKLFPDLDTFLIIFF